jgi:G3E family GTPase
MPVPLLTGLLGAGKTTLLNDGPSDARAGRVDAIVTAFVAAGLDHDLIERSEVEHGLDMLRMQLPSRGSALEASRA